MKQKFVGELDKIIRGKHIKTVFQPIISLRNGEVCGYEALSRVTCPTDLANPEDLFRAARTCNRLWKLDQLCRSTALQSFRDRLAFSGDSKLFLNVSPIIISHEQFSLSFTRHYLKQYGLEPNRIVFEITERNSIPDIEKFKAAIDHSKSEQFQIAIDDAGAMYSGLNLINAIHPHYIKLDRRLIHDIDLGGLNFALIKGMTEFCRLSNIHLIAEGIETESELTILIDLGVPYAQGFFLQKPDEQLKTVDDDIRTVIIDCHKRKNNVFGSPSANSYISNICTQSEIVSRETKVEDIYNKLKANPDAFGFCVVENGHVIGIITKSHLTLQLSGQFGFSLYQNQPVSLLMDTEFIAVDYQTPINEVSKAAMSRPQEKLYDFIVVTKDGKYLGTVTIKNLLQKTTEIEVVKAKYENPLTGLPGNLVIEQKIRMCLSEKKAFGILYLDINHFKEYNDIYGFENGDCVIKLLADILVLHLPPGQFVGHVGGDDFVVILDDKDLKSYCDAVSSEFQRKVLHYYNPSDKANGYIIAENRWGVIERFSLITTSAAGIRVQSRDFASVPDLTERLAQLKKKCKKLKDDNYLLIQT